MRASGNGNPAVCANNLLSISRGEVPYERIKGLDPRLIGKPISTVEQEIQQDGRWLLETYEPRVNVSRISVSQTDAVAGGFQITADIEGKEE